MEPEASRMKRTLVEACKGEEKSGIRHMAIISIIGVILFMAPP
jgi:hypothetical protein